MSLTHGAHPSMHSNHKCEPSVGFPVDNVKKSTNPLPSVEWIIKSVKVHCNSIPEAFSKPKDSVIVARTLTHGFMTAVHLAYSQHYPLEISPDDIWLCIVQGFAAHVHANSEKSHYEFENRERIKIRRDDFVKGCPNNPWPEVFEEFSTQIRSQIGSKMHNILVPTFTTTGPTHKAAAEIVMVNALEKYCEYNIATLCGIPEVVLKGSVDDWRNLRERTLGPV